MDAPPAPPPVPPKKRGCLFYGCLTLAVVFLLFGLLGYVGYQYARKSLSNLVEQYTDSAPAKFEPVQLSKEEADDLQRRVTAFQQALDRQTEQRELVLSEQEVNALILQNPNLKDKLQVRIEEDRVRGLISWPLEDIGPLKFSGRYLNGLATLRVSLNNGQLALKLEDVQVNGKPLPAPLMTELTKKDLAQEVMRDPNAAKNISKFESLEIQDSKVILRNQVAQ